MPDTHTQTDWASSFAADVLTRTQVSEAAHVTAAERKAAFRALVTSTAPAFMERLGEACSTAIEAISYTVGRALVRVFRTVDGRCLVRNHHATSCLDIEPSFHDPNDLQPGVRVVVRLHGRGGAVRHFRFAEAEAGGRLALIVDGLDLDADAAAAALLTPWLNDLDLVTDESVYRRLATHLFLENLTAVPKRVVKSPVQCARLAAPASAEDVVTVHAIDENAFQSAWTAGMLRAAARDGRLIVARRDGVIVAFAIGQMKDDTITIQRIAVAEHARRQGIGGAVLRFALAEGAREGARRATVSTNPTNTIARKLYASAGFRAAQATDQITTTQGEVR